MLTTKRHAIQILHISTCPFTIKRGYNYFISKYTAINSLRVTQINLLHNDTFCSTWFAHFRCKKGSLHVNSVMILEVFIDTCGTGKRNYAGALVLGNGRIYPLSSYKHHQNGNFGLLNHEFVQPPCYGPFALLIHTASIFYFCFYIEFHFDRGQRSLDTWWVTGAGEVLWNKGK